MKIAMIAYDERTCDECLELDGEEVPLKEAFSNGVDAPPFHPACRCTIYVVPKDMPRQESMIPEKDRAALEERGLTPAAGARGRPSVALGAGRSLLIGYTGPGKERVVERRRTGQSGN